MPQRFLRPGITTSDRWNACSESAQNLYTRLLTVVDDYGRYDARPAVIVGSCYSVFNALNESVAKTPAMVEKMLAELAQHDLIKIYQSGTKTFIQFQNWHERARIKSQWPEPLAQNVRTMSAECPHDVVTVSAQCPPPSPSPSPSPSPAPHAHTRQPESHLPTWEEVKTEAELRGVTEASAKTFFDHHQGNNLWINQHGKLINWQHKLKTWGENDRQPKPTNANRSTNRPSTPNRNAGTYNDKPLSPGVLAKVR